MSLPKKFAFRYKNSLFKTVKFEWNGKKYEIQFNTCTNPFCKWCGLPQEKFNIKGKPSRYKLDSSVSSERVYKCNPDPINPNSGITLNCRSVALSNWSIAEEISRLIRNDSTVEIEENYVFHRDECGVFHLTPFEKPELFYKRGKSKGNSQRYQCRLCKKYTSLLPKREKNSRYKQKRNDILPTFTRLLLNKTPISRACEILEIGRSTYYHKLEWVYRCCLEFLERQKTKPLKQTKFKELWLNSDKMVYYLNNVRKKGHGGKTYDIEDLNFQTNIIISAENFTRYVFRADVAYDWDVTFSDIENDTITLKEDHLNEFSRKNACFGKYSYMPQEPSKNDEQSMDDYYHEMKQIEKRQKYIDGLHTNITYTSIAHFWLIKELLNADEWRFITDDDSSLKTSIIRVFSKEIKLSDAHYFICQTDKTKSRKEAIQEYEEAKEELLEWGYMNDIVSKSLNTLALRYLSLKFQNHQFHKQINDGNKIYNVHGHNPIEHPLATKDRGKHIVDCITDLSSYEPGQIAKMVMYVNDNAINSFIQLVKRRLSVLERPLTTARGDGKSYIYANFNPKYAQMAITILRTYYNFCLPFRSRKFGKIIKETPAQRLEIANKQYTIEDILYMR